MEKTRLMQKVRGKRKMLYSFSVKMPLVYNSSSVRSKIPETEMFYGLEREYEENCDIIFRSFEIPGYEEGYVFRDVINMRLCQTDQDDNLGIILVFEMNGILACNEEQAQVISERIVNKLCRKLSVVFARYNSNCHCFHPRVEVTWSAVKCRKSNYAPFMELLKKNCEKTKEVNKLHVEVLGLKTKVNLMLKTVVPYPEIKLCECVSQNNDEIEFIENEYYSALGTEKLKSKFFHLFTIIEFCEKEYEEHNGSQRLLSDDKISTILKSIKDNIDTSIRDKVLSSVKKELTKANDTGRAVKLQNILLWMGITKYNSFGKDIDINKEILDKVIKLRNMSFHGTKENALDVEEQYADAVAILLNIDLQILNYLSKRHQCTGGFSFSFFDAVDNNWGNEKKKSILIHVGKEAEKHTDDEGETEDESFGLKGRIQTSDEETGQCQIVDVIPPMKLSTPSGIKYV